LTEEYARNTWKNDAIISPEFFDSTAGKTQIDIEIPSLRLTVELTSSEAASEYTPRKLQQSLKQLEVISARGQALAQVFDGNWKLFDAGTVREVVQHGGWTEELASRPIATTTLVENTSIKSASGPKSARGFATVDTQIGIAAGGAAGFFGGLMSYTAMMNAKLDAEEQESFEPIKDETVRQLGGLAGGVAAGEVGAAVGIPAGPVGIVIGAAVGFVGGALGYGMASFAVEDDDIDPTYKRFCAPQTHVR